VIKVTSKTCLQDAEQLTPRPANATSSSSVQLLFLNVLRCSQIHLEMWTAELDGFVTVLSVLLEHFQISTCRVPFQMGSYLRTVLS